MGLSTVYGIVQQHEGWIECASEPGQGTTFSVYLPAIEFVSEQKSADAENHIPSGAETILLIEDEALLSSALKLTLEGHGYTVLEGADGQDGLEIFRRQWQEIDLVVLDLSMPRMSGRDALPQLQALNPALKVIIFSGYEARQEEFAQVQCILRKPVKEQELCNAVRQVLDAS